MSETSEILAKSFKLLRAEPRLFLPKLASTFLSSIWLLSFASKQISTTQALVSLPIISLLGVFVSLMVASMVKNKESDNILKIGFLEALRNWRKILITSLIFILIVFLITLPFSIGFALYIRSGNVIALSIGFITTLLLIVALGFLSYFLPITLLEYNSVFGGFKESMRTSTKSSKTVLALTFFSIVVFLFAYGSSKSFQALGYTIFLSARLIASTVNTYLFVISPSYYLDQKN